MNDRALNRSRSAPRRLVVLATIVAVMMLAVGVSPASAATTSKYPTGNTPVSGAWAGTGNVTADDGTYASIVEAQSSSAAIDWHFDFNGIPAGSVINSVEVAFDYHLFDGTGADSVSAQPRVSGTPVGSPASDSSNPTSDVVVSQSSAGLTRADLVDPSFAIRFTYTRGASGTLNNSVYLDYVRITVDYTPPDQPPVLDPIGTPITVAEGETKDVVITASDPDNDPVTIFWAQLPSFVTPSDDGQGTATLHLAPTYTDAGDYGPFIIGVTAGGKTDTQSITIQVTNTDRPPVLDPITPIAVAEGATLDVPLSATDPDGDVMTFFAGALPSLPAWITVDGTPSATGDSVLHLAPGLADAGDYTITVGVSAGSGVDSQQVVIHVVNTDQSPVLKAIKNQTVAEGATRAVKLSATDPDGDRITLSLVGIVDPVLHAQLTDNGDGTGTLTFTPDFTAAASSPYTISVEATTDANTGVSQRSFQLTVTEASPSDPVVTVPADQTVEATSAAGATVDLSALGITATDAEDGDVSASLLCSIDGGTNVQVGSSVFPIGTSTVTCTATDSENNIGVGTFSVTVEDTTAPQINAPGGGTLPDISVHATSRNGAVVTFGAVATDVVDGSVPVTCTPASGSLFPVGRTQVACSATDRAGNGARLTFLVTVQAAATPRPTVTIPPTDTRPPGANPSSPAPAGLAWVGLLVLATSGVALGLAGRRSHR